MLNTTRDARHYVFQSRDFNNNNYTNSIIKIAFGGTRGFYGDTSKSRPSILQSRGVPRAIYIARAKITAQSCAKSTALRRLVQPFLFSASAGPLAVNRLRTVVTGRNIRSGFEASGVKPKLS